MCARQRLQDVGEDTEEAGCEHAGAHVHAVGQRHGGRAALGRSCAGAAGAGCCRVTRGRGCASSTAGATRGGGSGRLGCAARGCRVVGDVFGAAVVLDVSLALALPDGIVGVSSDAAGKVGLADEVRQGVLVRGEIGGGTVLAEALVGQFLLRGGLA